MNYVRSNRWLAFLCLGLTVCIAQGQPRTQEPNLPEDTTIRLKVLHLRISGNTLIPTENILERMPLIYNASDKPLLKAESMYLYDLRAVHGLFLEPNAPQEISLRTIQGLTLYILSEYQKKNYAGIYVYVPQGTMNKEQTKLTDDTLVIKILEAPVSSVGIKYFGMDQNEVENGYLRRQAVESWSPLKTDKVANRQSLDYFVNLLNLDPDRHVAVKVSKGADPNSLAFEYDIYETSPWHYFIQVDNSGTSDRQWAPRAGVINTNLFGIDDKLTTVYQARPDSTFDDNYALFGSYDVPIMGPRLRLNLFIGHSEFDVSPESGPFNFLGRGTFYGALLRYNVYQTNGWFFDITGSLSHEKSKVTPSLFPSAAADVRMDLYSVALELHRSNDTSDSSFVFNRAQSYDGSSREKFQLARTQAEPDFSIYTLSANHNQFLDIDKIHEVKGIFKWITSDERLVPAKMTSFGGMYTVRGYDEYEIVADGGILASIQYEFDWLRYEAIEKRFASEPNQPQPEKTNTKLNKLSPLAFMDYGQASIKDPVAGEKAHQTLWSVGIGAAAELGKNLSGALYYGYPLRATDDTREGKGRLNVSFMLRW
jgi:hemolysin activation/secretion protein